MRPPLELLWLGAALAIPSWAVVAKFGGGAGVVIYCAGVAAALLVVPRVTPRVARRAVASMSLMTLLAVVLLFALAYPRLNVQTAGRGSDDDDGHNTGVAALLDGTSPYSRQTYLGNELHQLPGSFILAAPFALLGSSALQNLACLPLFLSLVSRRTRDARTPLVLAWLVLLLSPGVLHQIVTGSSYSWNAIWVLSGIWWVWSQPRSLTASIFCGVAMCSRPNFLILLAPLYGAMSHAHGRTAAVRSVAGAAMTAAGLALPFYVISPKFGPREGFSVLAQFDGVVPGAGVAILIVTALAAIGLSRVRVDLDGLMLQCAVVQAIPVLAVVMLSAALDDGARFLKLTAYTTFASWFAIMGAAARIESWLMGEPPSARGEPLPDPVRRG